MFTQELKNGTILQKIIQKSIPIDYSLQEKLILQPLECPNLSTTKSEAEDFLDLMYHHPDDPKIRGRPFSGLIDYGDVLKKYLKSREIKLPKIDFERGQKNLTFVKEKFGNLYQPQLVTALSSNHFKEHVEAIKFAFHYWMRVFHVSCDSS